MAIAAVVLVRSSIHNFSIEVAKHCEDLAKKRDLLFKIPFTDWKCGIFQQKGNYYVSHLIVAVHISN